MSTAGPAGALLAEHLAKSGEAVKSGPIGLGVILLLCIACYFLFKSMSKHLRTVREDFPKNESATTQHIADPRAIKPDPVDLRKTPNGDRAIEPPGPSALPPVHP